MDGLQPNANMTCIVIRYNNTPNIIKICSVFEELSPVKRKCAHARRRATANLSAPNFKMGGTTKRIHEKFCHAYTVYTYIVYGSKRCLYMADDTIHK